MSIETTKTWKSVKVVVVVGLVSSLALIHFTQINFGPGDVCAW